MSNNKEYCLDLDVIPFPQTFPFFEEIKNIKEPSLEIKYRIRVHVISSEIIKILFGSQVSHKKLEKEKNL